MKSITILPIRFPAGTSSASLRRVILLGMLTLGLIACTATTPVTKGSFTGTSTSLVVDPFFQRFYQQLGGEEVLGPPISPKFSKEGAFYQFTPAVQMVYDPSLPESQRFSLAPIGVQMGIQQPMSSPDSPGGHAVFSGFQELYDQLGGAAIVGLPLTDVIYDAEYGSIQQYFERMGFYQLENDAPDIVRLLHYGAWFCSTSCEYTSPEEARPRPEKIIQTPFAEALSRLPLNLLGPPLTEAYQASDGYQERIYTNAVVVRDPSRPGGIRLRPITAMLGFPAQLGLDYDVPDVFQEFISKNSGIELFGNAVSPFEQQSDETYLQCFENMCLEYNPSRPPELQVRPLALGEMYKKEFYQKQETNTVQTRSQADGSLILSVSKGYSSLSPSDPQIISVWVYKDGQPAANIQPVIEVTFSNDQFRIYRMQATRQDGFTSIEIPPFENAQKGTWVHYQVCVSASRQIACVEDKYLLWVTPKQ